MSSFFLGIITGGLATLVLLIVGALSLIRFSDIYGLGHWVLNVEAPLPSMWMNLGFWYVSDGSSMPVLHGRSQKTIQLGSEHFMANAIAGRIVRASLCDSFEKQLERYWRKCLNLRLF